MYCTARPLHPKTIVAISLLLCINACFGDDYSYVVFDHPKASAGLTQAKGINDAGEVVGTFWETQGGNHGFSYRDGVFSTFDAPNTPTGLTTATGINNDGKIVGYYNLNPFNVFTFVYDGNAFNVLDTTALSTTTKITRIIGNGINASGSIAGTYSKADGNYAYVYNAGNYTTLDIPNAKAGTTSAVGINDQGSVVGNFQDNQGLHGFMYKGGSYTTLDVPGADLNSTAPTGINNKNSVTGTFKDTTGIHGFIYQAGSYTTINAPEAKSATYVNGINNKDQLVGWYNDTAGKSHSFIATPTQPNTTTPKPVETPTPPATTATSCKTNTQYFPASQEVTFEDVEFNGQHYWAKLIDQGGLKFLVVDYHLVAAGTCAEAMLVHFKDGLVSIPSVKVASESYQVVLQQVDTRLLFEVKTSLKISQ